jgi:hypothetical protein
MDQAVTQLCYSTNQDVVELARPGDGPTHQNLGV